MCAVMAQGRSALQANGSRSASQVVGARRAAARGGCPPGRGRGRARACRPAGRRRRAARRRRRGRGGRRRPGRAAKARSPITSLAPGMREVEHRRGDHVEAGGGAVEADQRAGQPGRAQAGCRVGGEAARRARRPADGRASAAGAGGRRGRPPGPPSARPRGGRTRRSAAVSAAAAAGRWMLRANRMTPAGGMRAEQRGFVGRAASGRRCRRWRPWQVDDRSRRHLVTAGLTGHLRDGRAADGRIKRAMTAERKFRYASNDRRCG